MQTLFNWIQITDSKSLCYGATRNQAPELYLLSSTVSVTAFVVSVCKRPPVCMVFNCMTVPALTRCSLCSLLTKGDNYVMSTFRRLEVGAAAHLCVNEEIKCELLFLKITECINVSSWQLSFESFFHIYSR